MTTRQVPDPKKEAERRKRLSIYRMGKTHSKSTKEKISKSHVGIRQTEESRKKISESHKGVPLSEHHRKKISLGHKGLFVGDKSPNWRGGASFEPYCIKFNTDFKGRVRGFFNHECVECGSHIPKEKPHVHHVNFNKKACCDSSIPLFVILCRSCHAKTNQNRAFWEDWFTEIINEFYGGKCYFPKNEQLGV